MTALLAETIKATEFLANITIQLLKSYAYRPLASNDCVLYFFHKHETVNNTTTTLNSVYFLLMAKDRAASVFGENVKPDVSRKYL